MSRLCTLCSNIPFLDLPPFPPWLGSGHIPISPTSNLVPFVPQAYALEDSGEADDHDETSRSSRRYSKRKVKKRMSLGFPHHPSLEALSETADICDLCRVIQSSVLEVKGIWEDAQEDSWFSYYDDSGPPKYELFLSARREGEDGFIVWSKTERERDSYALAAVGYCVDDGSSLRHRFRGRPVLEDAKAPINFDRYRDWLRQCEDGHDRCKRPQTRPATPNWPLRLLDLGDDSDPSGSLKLVEAPPVGLKYATLSHCWGDSLHFKLTHATMHSHKEAIDIHDLPQTYQDAIRITRELDVQHLWIDSLCICQDDGADWERESAKMANIYSNAYICIACASAASDAAGFLNDRYPRGYIEVAVTSQDADTKEPLSGQLKLFSLQPHLAAHGSHYIAMEHEPLATRAWAMQERYLAPQKFIFGTSQSFFECATHFLSEDGYHNPHPLFTLKLPSAPKSDVEIPSVMRYRRGQKWYELLRQYSSRSMTKPTDKLPALSGLARAFADEMGGQYVAGLWKDDIIEGLTYQCFGGAHSRPEEWRAPTWSWASVDGMLAITAIGDFSEDLVEVGDVDVQVKGENPFGEVSGGELRMRCFLEKLTVSKEPEEDAEEVPHKRNVRLCFGDKDEPFGHYASFDIREAKDKDEISGLELYGIPLAAKPSESAYVLIVSPNSDSGPVMFRREGYCMMGNETLIDRWIEAKRKGEGLTDVVLI